ncbi:hypothetical protein HU200_049829 [Digitaria exilis]|uniref:DUF3119 family protein n=1 Tax=Digitaria exilis TaxID=1010633 RepID=A0A835AT45_9POAL|nr:hypothetical protein HU200_049829 [Digitaria exilis]
MRGDGDSAENDEAESRKSLNDEKPEDSELLYAGPGFTVVSPDPSQLPMPTLLLLPRIAGASAYADNLLAAAPVGLLGLLLLFQEVKVGDQLQESGENVFVGGKNHWKYSTLVNWELWWPQFPILVYFKETQTKLEGQIHFFPVIFNGRQLYDVMVERAGPSKTSGPK